MADRMPDADLVVEGPVRLLIAGSRTLTPSITDIDEVVAALGHELTEILNRRHPVTDVAGMVTSVISGRAAGVDAAGETWAHARVCGPDCQRRLASQLPLQGKLPLCSAVEAFPADWRKFGTAAGPMRNANMARACDAAVVFWDGESLGTKSMISALEGLGRPRRVIRLGGR